FDFSLDASNLDFNQLVHAGAPEAHDMPGRLTAKVSLVGDPRDPKLLVGQGSARLTETDLADSKVISFLYNVMSVRLGPKVPSGRGSTTFRLEGTDVNITSLYYFN